MSTEKLKKERETIESCAAKLIEQALKNGADSAEVCASYGVHTKISLEKQDFHMAASDDGYNLGLRVMVGKRQGFASCNSVESKELKEIAQRAVDIAKLSPENPFYSIEATENVPRQAPNGAWDDSLFGVSLQTQKDWAKWMADEAMKDPRFRMNEGSVVVSGTLFLVQSSKGTHKVQRESAVSWSLMGMAVDGDNITSFDYFSQMNRKASGLPDRIPSSARRFRDSLAHQLKHASGESYKGLIVFSPRAVLEVFASPLCYHMNGRNVVEGTSRWKMSDLGTTLLDERFGIEDIPWSPEFSGFSLFDREGTPTQNRWLIEKGILKTILMDQYAAQALSAKSTGHAGGGPSTLPAVGPHTLRVAKGNEELSSLLKRTTQKQSKFLLVHRFSGQVDPVTGDFSGVAKGGEWWEGGERQGFVQETLISGNLFEALSKQLFGVSKETENVHNYAEAPTLVVDGLSVTSDKK